MTTDHSGAPRGAVARETRARSTTNESFIAFRDVVAATAVSVFMREEHHELRAVVGRMTGLNMARYDLVEAPDAYGWHLVRRAPCAPAERSEAAP